MYKYFYLLVINNAINKHSSSIHSRWRMLCKPKNCLRCHIFSLSPIPKILYNALLVHLSNIRMLIADKVTASEPYSWKGKQVRILTVPLSAFLNLEKMQLKTRKILTFTCLTEHLKWVAVINHKPRYLREVTNVSSPPAISRGSHRTPQRLPMWTAIDF